MPSKPDRDNLDKAVLGAIGKRLWKDDGQVCAGTIEKWISGSCSRLQKYPTPSSHTIHPRPLASTNFRVYFRLRDNGGLIGPQKFSSVDNQEITAAPAGITTVVIPASWRDNYIVRLLKLGPPISMDS